jgi:hypothetical protein
MRTHILERQREGQTRKCKQSKGTTGTHQLESARRGSSQVRQRKRARDRHSLSGEPTGRVRSGKAKRAGERREHTLWRVQREGQVKKGKEWERATGTHSLKSVKEGQVRNRKESERMTGKLPTGKGTGRDKSEEVKNVS